MNPSSPRRPYSRRTALIAGLVFLEPLVGRLAEAARTQALDVSGEYLGTYTPQRGTASQLQMSLDPLQPGQGNQFTGYGSMRVNGDLLEFDITGSARRRRGAIAVSVEYVGNETNDVVNFSGNLNRRRGRLAGTFRGTLNGNAVNGRFSVTRR